MRKIITLFCLPEFTPAQLPDCEDTVTTKALS